MNETVEAQCISYPNDKLINEGVVGDVIDR